MNTIDILKAMDTQVVTRPVGLRESHYAACHEDGMSDEEIEADWDQVERDMAAWVAEEQGRDAGQATT